MTQNHFLIFDYWKDTPNGGLDKGVVDPAEIAAFGRQVVVFSSHAHGDHYNPVILDWPNAKLVLSSDIPPAPGAVMVEPDSEYEILGISLRTFQSTDEGVAFLIKVDGNTIYHAGDLNWWHWTGEPDDFNRDMSQRYREQIDKMRGVKIDLAFVPVDPRLKGQYSLGIDYLMRTADVGKAVPIHFGERAEIIDKLIADPVSEPYRERILPLMTRGQSADV